MMQEITFIDKCIKGEASLDEIDDYIDAWHDGITPEDIELHTYLGMTWDEYSSWVRDSSILESIINKKNNNTNNNSNYSEVYSKEIDKAVSSLAKITFDTLYRGEFPPRIVFKERIRKDIYKASNKYILNCIDKLENVRLCSSFSNLKLSETENRFPFTVRNQTKKAYRLTNTDESRFFCNFIFEGRKKREQSYKQNLIPMFFELEYFVTSEIDIKQIISEEFRKCGFPEFEKMTNRALEKGKLLILLYNSLDKVPINNYDSLTNTIQDFTNRYDKNYYYYLASNKASFYQTRFNCFPDAKRFDDNQIEQCINYWFNLEADIMK